MSTSSSITLTARQWRDLIAPVLPFAGTDDMLPVLCAAQVRTQGKWLIATTTDRFRVGIKRIEKTPTDGDESLVWPAFSALIPTKAVKSISSMLKPSRNNFNAGATFTVTDDRLTVEASGLFEMFDAARFTHTLMGGEFPAVWSIAAKALAVPDADRIGTLGVNPRFLADYASICERGMPLRVRNGASVGDPILFTDEAGFIGLLMPRRADLDAESWEDLFAPKPAAEAGPVKPAKKARAKREPVSA